MQAAQSLVTAEEFLAMPRPADGTARVLREGASLGSADAGFAVSGFSLPLAAIFS